MFQIEEYIQEPSERQRNAFQLLNMAASGEPLYGGEYKVMKECLSRFFENTLDKAKEIFCDNYRDAMTATTEDGRTYTTEPNEISELRYKFPALTQITGYIKFLDKIDDTYKSDLKYQELRNVALKWNEIGLIVKNAKATVIKGKRPSMFKSESTKIREKLDAEKKTCPCCIGRFMVKPNGLMTHHGYKRPGIGADIGECIGAQRFRPLEVSLDGTYYMVKRYEQKLEEFMSVLKELPNQKELTFIKRKYNPESHKWDNEPVTVHPQDGYIWKQQYKSAENKLHNEIKYAEDMIVFYKNTMRNWFNVTYPIDKPECAEERNKYLEILHDYGLTSSQNKVKSKVTDVSR